MRVKNLLFCLALIATGIGFTGCDKEEENIITPNNPDEVVEYTIGLPEEDEKFTFVCEEKAVKGKKITAKLTILTGYEEYLPSLIVTAENDETVTPEESVEEKESGIVYTYTFSMPESNITLAVDLSIDMTEYTIDPLPANAIEGYCTFDCVRTARRNQSVTATLTVLPEHKRLIPIFNIKTLSSKKAVNYTHNSKLSESGERIFTYTFKMPGENVTTSATFSEDNRLLISKNIENVFLWILNAYDENNPEIPSSEPERQVGFHFNVELGYEFTEEAPEVRGDESNKIQYTYWNPDGTLNGYSYVPCWTFSMPDEPVTINVLATEKTTYADKDFTGDYKGYQIAALGEQMISGASTLALNLDGNTSYSVTSTDVNRLNFRGEYIMDETNKKFNYDEERIYDPAYDTQDISMYSHGLSGQVLEDGDLFIWATDLVTDRAENIRFYYASKEDCSYTCASRDIYGKYCLLEVIKSNGTQYYLFDGYYNTLTKAEVEFISGTTIGGDAVALVSVDGVVRYKYSHTTGNAPIFTESDKVNGTYTGSNGELTLDGFGNATIGGQSGTYTLSDSKTLATVTVGGVETTYVINTSAKTYTVFDPNAWMGPKKFYAETTGIVDGATASSRITVLLDAKYFNESTEALGEGAIIAEIAPTPGSWQKVFTTTMSAYRYDAEAKTLTFEKIRTRTDLSQTENYNPVTFKVSDDLQTLTSTHDVLYNQSGLTYINLKDVEIKAVVVE